MSDDIAVGAPVFSRTAALRQLLESVPDYVSSVYIADNGENDDERNRLYSRSWPFNLQVIELDYDVGIGPCRHAIADAADEPYLWMGDCDMEFTRPTDLTVLRSILDKHPDLGGVAGYLKEGDTIRSGARDLQVRDDLLLQQLDEDPTVFGEPYPHARFEFIPQAGLFRTDIYETYTYDDSLQNTEHVDFFLGQKRAGEWTFASTPAVITLHHKDIDEQYRKSRRGDNAADMDVLAEKWGINRVAPGTRVDWVETRDQTTAEAAFDVFRRVTPARVWAPVRDVAMRVMRG